MNLEKQFNRILSWIWKPDADGNRPVWFHWQNLNADAKGDPNGWPFHGRCWIHAPRKVWRFCWHLRSTSFGFGVATDSEDGGLLLNAAVPPVALYFHIPINIQKRLDTPFWARWNERTGGYKGSHRYTGFRIAEVRVFNWAVWWSFLKFDWGWSAQMPKWMDGNIQVLDVLFGRSQVTDKPLGTHEVGIPMPEGSYPASIKLEERTWKRKRLPWNSHRGRYATVDVRKGIPHEGKGENSWDCGTDALFGLSCEAATVEEAIAKTVQAALRSRRKYDGDVMAQYPAPEVSP